MREGDALVRHPLVVNLGVIDEDDEVFVGALEVDLDLGSFSASHVVGVCGCVSGDVLV